MRVTSRGLMRGTWAIILAIAALAGGAMISVRQALSQEIPKAGGPKVVFEFEWAQADPHWYQISVDALGNTEYQSQPKLNPGETQGEPYVLKFIVTSKTRERIFALASAANRFEGNFDYKGSTRMAQTGAKTLRYVEDGKTTASTFNYSDNKNVMELATVFQSIALTVDMGHELSQARRFDKLGVDAILRRLEEMAKDNDVIEIQAIAPVLRQIVDDHLSLNIARQRANRLLASASQ